jgi:hypothetical protein
MELLGKPLVVDSSLAIPSERWSFYESLDSRLYNGYYANRASVVDFFSVPNGSWKYGIFTE